MPCEKKPRQESDLRPNAAGSAETFQWIETFTCNLTLLSLTTQRYPRVDFETSALLADSLGPEPNGPDGVRFDWKEIGKADRAMHARASGTQ